MREQTSRDQSPAVVAANIRITYGIPPNITSEIIEVYSEEYSSPEEKHATVETLIRNYKSLSLKKAELTEEDKDRLGIKDNEKIVDILNYDIFISTKGSQSPAIYAPGGSAEIWYGIPSSALKALWCILEEKQVAIQDFHEKLHEQVQRYKELERELTFRSDYDEIASHAKVLLVRGDIFGAERILEEDVMCKNKQTAYRNYEVGKIKEQNLKIKEATEYYRIAALLDKQNPDYTLSYGINLFNAANYDEAINQFQLAIEILPKCQQFEFEKGLATCRKFIASAYQAKGEYDKAVEFL